MKIRVLAEQTPHSSQPDRGYLPSGEVVDIEKAWALELLQRGEAEAVAVSPARGARKATARKGESR